MTITQLFHWVTEYILPWLQVITLASIATEIKLTRESKDEKD